MATGFSATPPERSTCLARPLNQIVVGQIAQQFGINGLAEAQAYLAEPVLRLRLEEVIRVVREQLEQPGQTLEHLMGSVLDAAKTISCLTLFEAAGLSSAEALLNQLGQRCAKTQAMLNAPAEPPQT